MAIDRHPFMSDPDPVERLRAAHPRAVLDERRHTSANITGTRATAGGALREANSPHSARACLLLALFDGFFQMLGTRFRRRLFTMGGVLLVGGIGIDNFAGLQIGYADRRLLV